MSAGGTRGFTLLELLLATALTAAMAALAFGQLRFGLAAWERQTTGAGTASPGLVAGRLGTLIEGARMTPISQADFAQRVPFSGGETAMSFVRADRRPEPGYGLWRLRIEGAAPDLRLIVERAPIGEPRDAFAAQVWGPPVFALDGLEGAAFAYAAASADAPDWRPTWPDRATAPALIRLQFTLRGRLWSVVAHPEIGR